MYARVARFEGGDADALRRSAEDATTRGGEGPPPGVPAVGYTMLFDAASGVSLGIVLFETEEDLRTGDAALNEMTPSAGDVGHRTSVETFEVGADLRLERT